MSIDTGQQLSFEANFPSPNKNQPSQQFRDNFAIIKTAIENIQSLTYSNASVFALSSNIGTNGTYVVTSSFKNNAFSLPKDSITTDVANIRYNTTNNKLEFRNTDAWTSVISTESNGIVIIPAAMSINDTLTINKMAINNTDAVNKLFMTNSIANAINLVNANVISLNNTVTALSNALSLETNTRISNVSLLQSQIIANSVYANTQLNATNIHFGIIDTHLTTIDTRLNGHDNSIVLLSNIVNNDHALVIATSNSLTLETTNRQNSDNTITATVSSLSMYVNSVVYSSLNNAIVLESSIRAAQSSTFASNIISINTNASIMNTTVTNLSSDLNTFKPSVVQIYSANTAPVMTTRSAALGSLWFDTSNSNSIHMFNQSSFSSNSSNTAGYWDSIAQIGVSSVNGQKGDVSIVEDAIVSGHTAIAPSGNSVYNALNLKANVASPTFTGTVSGITKTMVGLSNVDNTSDLNKPVSNATQTALNLKINSSLIGLANGVAPLGTNSKVPSIYLPSYTDSIVEVANYAALPSTGVSGTIYVTLDTSKTYRWGGTIYVELSASPGSTDAVPEGSVNLYFTTGRASAAAPVQSVSGRTGTVTLSKSDVGLSNADNTSDVNKPISTATQSALDGKQNLDATLTALAGISTVANKLIYATGSDTFATTDLTSAGRTLIGASDVASQRSILGLGSASLANIGISGTTVPTLDSNSVVSGYWSFTRAPVFTDVNGTKDSLGLGTSNSVTHGTVNSIGNITGSQIVSRGNGSGQEGGQIVWGYGDGQATSITGQTNCTYNLDSTGLTGSDIARFFSIRPDGSAIFFWSANPNTGVTNFGTSPTVPNLSVGTSTSQIANAKLVNDTAANKVNKSDLTYWSGNVDVNNITSSGFYRLGNANTNYAGADYGNLIVTSGDNTVGQIGINYQNDSHVIRGGVINDTWQPWRTIATREANNLFSGTNTFQNMQVFKIDTGQMIADGVEDNTLEIRSNSTTASGGDAFTTFHLLNRYACHFGLTDTFGGSIPNDIAVGGFSMGSTKYRIWHDGNKSVMTVLTQSQGDNSNKPASTAYTDTGLSTKSNKTERILLSEYASLALAQAAATSANLPITLAPGNYTVSTDTTITSPIVGSWQGVTISVNSGKTLTIRNYYPIDYYKQIFTGSGSVIGLRYTRPEWWGAKGDGTTNDVAAFQATITSIQGSYNSFGGQAKVVLSNANYLLSSTWYIYQTANISISIEGAGTLIGGTRLLSPSSYNNTLVSIEGSSDSTQRIVDFTFKNISLISGTAGFGVGLEFNTISGNNLTGLQENLVENIHIEGFKFGILATKIRLIQFKRVSVWNDSITSLENYCFQLKDTLLSETSTFSGDITLNECQFVSNASNTNGHGLWIETNTSTNNIAGVRVNQSIFYSCGVRLLTAAGTSMGDVWVDKCQFDNNQGMGVYITQNGTGSSDIIADIHVTNNYFTAVSGNCVRLEGAHMGGINSVNINGNWCAGVSFAAVDGSKCSAINVVNNIWTGCSWSAGSLMNFVDASHVNCNNNNAGQGGSSLSGGFSHLVSFAGSGDYHQAIGNISAGLSSGALINDTSSATHTSFTPNI